MLLFRLEQYTAAISGTRVNQICIERRLFLLKKILEGHAPDYLSEKRLSLKYHNSHDTRSRLSYRLPFFRAVGKERRFKTRHALERNREPITHGLWAPTEEIKRAKFGKLKKKNRNKKIL